MSTIEILEEPDRGGIFAKCAEITISAYKKKLSIYYGRYEDNWGFALRLVTNGLNSTEALSVEDMYYNSKDKMLDSAETGVMELVDKYMKKDKKVKEKLKKMIDDVREGRKAKPAEFKVDKFYNTGDILTSTVSSLKFPVNVFGYAMTEEKYNFGKYKKHFIIRDEVKTTDEAVRILANKIDNAIRSKYEKMVAAGDEDWSFLHLNNLASSLQGLWVFGKTERKVAVDIRVKDDASCLSIWVRVSSPEDADDSIPAKDALIFEGKDLPIDEKLRAKVKTVIRDGYPSSDGYWYHKSAEMRGVNQVKKEEGSKVKDKKAKREVLCILKDDSQVGSAVDGTDPFKQLNEVFKDNLLAFSYVDERDKLGSVFYSELEKGKEGEELLWCAVHGAFLKTLKGSKEHAFRLIDLDTFQNNFNGTWIFANGVVYHVNVIARYGFIADTIAYELTMKQGNNVTVKVPEVYHYLENLKASQEIAQSWDEDEKLTDDGRYYYNRKRTREPTRVPIYCDYDWAGKKGNFFLDFTHYKDEADFWNKAASVTSFYFVTEGEKSRRDRPKEALDEDAKEFAKKLATEACKAMGLPEKIMDGPITMFDRPPKQEHVEEVDKAIRKGIKDLECLEDPKAAKIEKTVDESAINYEFKQGELF